MLPHFPYRHPARMLVPAFLLIITPVLSEGQQTSRREIQRTDERELHVKLDASFGTVYISRGSSDVIVMAEYTTDERDPEAFSLQYHRRGRSGELVIRAKEESRFWKKSSDRDKRDRVWHLQFSDAIPITFSIELGAGRGDFDVSGLQVRKLKISSGASAVDLLCTTPNRIQAEDIVIESGVSKFTAVGLANLNFRTMKFSGGVGAYQLDFGGTLRQDADVSIELGLGAVSIVIPRDTPTRLKYDDSWFSSLDLDDGFSRTRKGFYETESYRLADGSLNIQIESGLGSVKVRVR
ncbi:MAG: LiaF domain-containing protein [Bacteroidota bacterium]